MVGYITDYISDNLNFEQIQRNFYMKSRAVRVTSGHKEFEVLPGYSFSINIYEAGLFLCANVKAKVMPKHNVLDVIKVMTHNIKPNDS